MMTFRVFDLIIKASVARTHDISSLSSHALIGDIARAWLITMPPAEIIAAIGYWAATHIN